MRDFRQRSNESELIDEDGISFAEFHHCLRSLKVINMLTLAYRPTLRWLEKIIRGQKKPLSILDAGSGSGDMLRQIEKLSRRNERPVALMGIDVNPWSQRSAVITDPNSPIRYETVDIFACEPDPPVDIIICSLFTHHLDEQQLVRFLRWMDDRALQGWFINDLHRHWLPYYFIKAMTAVFSRNRLIRHDAAVSVARAFTAPEWQCLLEKAGVSDRAHVQWFFPFRLCVSCRKN